jgi:predicted TIM-barrel enzyme
MMNDLFNTTKPIIGVVQLLPLPGSTEWHGDRAGVIQRAEQEAAALASGGVDAILVENSFDLPRTVLTETPFFDARLDPAACLMMADIVKRVHQLTQLPVGVSVLPNDPQSALAIAMNTHASFVHVRVMAGVLFTEHGLIPGKADVIKTYLEFLQLPEAVPLLTTLSLDHWVGGTPHRVSVTGVSAINPLPVLNTLQHVRHLVEVHQQLSLPVTAFIMSHELLSAELFQTLQQQVSLPFFLTGHVTPENVTSLYTVADGLVLTESIKKPVLTGLDARTTIDPMKLESLLKRLREEHRRGEDIRMLHKP